MKAKTEADIGRQKLNEEVARSFCTPKNEFVLAPHSHSCLMTQFALLVNNRAIISFYNIESALEECARLTGVIDGLKIKLSDELSDEYFEKLGENNG